jgi:isoquinoline 1-oxidoreductase beta subunit
MGQGSSTALAMLMADELGADPSHVEVILGAPVDPNFINPKQYKGEQITDGSRSIISFADRMIDMGASARQMLCAAAARRWSVPVEALEVKNNQVLDPSSGKTLRFADIAADAATLAPPGRPLVQNGKKQRSVGESTPRFDIPPKVTGTATFAIDVEVPNMAYAAVRHAPVLEGEAIAFDSRPILSLPGVVAVEKVPGGIAVVAESYWQARSALEKLEVTFSAPKKRLIDDNEWMTFLRSQRDRQPGVVAFERGEAEHILAIAFPEQRVAAEYSVPYLAHATMEPMNCTADYRGDHVEIWAGTQSPTLNRKAVTKLTGLAPEKITIHMTYAGGGFGRKGQSDEVVEAVTLSRAVKRPVRKLYGAGKKILRPTSFARHLSGAAWQHSHPTEPHRRFESNSPALESGILTDRSWW